MDICGQKIANKGTLCQIFLCAIYEALNARSGDNFKIKIKDSVLSKTGFVRFRFVFIFWPSSKSVLSEISPFNAKVVFKKPALAAHSALTKDFYI